MAFAHERREEAGAVRRKFRSFIGLTVLALIVLGPRPAAADSVSLPTVQSATLSNIGPNSQVSYAFNQGSGPLAVDFDDTNGSRLTSAQYVFSGQASNGVFVSAAWSPFMNATGGFVGFLGNDAGGRESDATVLPTQVANIVGTDGKTYGYVLAEYNTDNTGDNTLFTFKNTSNTTIDPTLTGETATATVNEQFTGTPQVSKPSQITNGTPTTTSNGFSVPNIVANLPVGTPNLTKTFTLSATQAGTITTSPAPDSISLSGGTVVITDPQLAGGKISIVGTESITDTTTNTVVQALGLRGITFSATRANFVGTTATFTFSASSQNGSLTMPVGHTFSVALSLQYSWTPSSTTAAVVADPNFGFQTGAQPLATAVPEPSTLLLAGLGAGCLGCFSWRRKRLMRCR